jgi:polysaccharide biosynthesis protein PslJ
LLSIFGWLGIALISCDFLLFRRSVDLVLEWLVTLTMILALLGMLQFVAGFDLASYLTIPGLKPNSVFAEIGQRSDFRRVSGTTSHPIEFGVVMAMVSPIALHLAFNSTGGRRVFNWVRVFAILTALPMTVSRSAVLGIIVGLIVLFVSWSGIRRTLAILLTPLILLVMSAALPGLLGTIRSFFVNYGSDPSIQGRTDDYAVVGKYIAQSPFLGKGFGTWVPAEFPILDNQYLGAIVEIGFLGVAALLLLFILGFFAGRGVMLRATDEATKDLGSALASSIVIVAVTFATFDGLGFPVVAGLTFLILGVTGAMWRLTGGGSRLARLPRKQRRELRALARELPVAR